MSKKAAQEFLKAAKLIDSGDEDFSCFALRHGKAQEATVGRYASLMYSYWDKRDKQGEFRICDIEKAAGVFGEGYDAGEYGKKTRNFRVLMLCMAAAVVEEDDDL